MDALNTRLDKMMHMLAKEGNQQLSTEENLRQTKSYLDAAVSQQNQSPSPPQIASAPPPTSSLNSMVLAKPQHSNKICGAAVKSFVGQILLHTVTCPEQFPTDSRKVDFAALFITEYTENWSQPFQMKVFNAEEVAFNKLLDKFKASFFEKNCQHFAEFDLRALCQTGTVLAYTQEFNSHTRTVGWADPLMSLYQHGLKENIQLAVVMSNIQFTSDYASNGPESRPEN
ncbi:uncharacterized protein VP01_573g5 [Puccinia sorghi]|uniref:Retrotransposon gag domain-containing protein n=1 Tax=Puccinia sorghi TaxID=27349 RepID=A0A0L6UKN2_9BASI|nr:uncharacterized protein VP01_573g5 [Puccinia sorghi]